MNEGNRTEDRLGRKGNGGREERTEEVKKRRV
jgi:hypothetical protein